MLYGLCGFMLVFTVVSAILVNNFQPPENSVSALAFVTVFLILRVLFYFRAVKMRCMQEREISNGELFTMSFDVTEQGIDMRNESTGGAYRVGFSQIKRAVRTKSMYILVSKAGWSYVFRKDSFTKGTHEEFRAFLRTKGMYC